MARTRFSRPGRRTRAAELRAAVVSAAIVVGCLAVCPARGQPPWRWWFRHHDVAPQAAGCCPAPVIGEGAWYWVRSPEQERQVVMALFNRYCIRCHGVDGRGVWDIPGVPNFADPRFQACRDDGALARSILEGRGAVMPPFRGTLTYEEAWAMARYLRTFVPAPTMPRPDRVPAEPASTTAPAAPARPRASAPAPQPASGPFTRQSTATTR